MPTKIFFTGAPVASTLDWDEKSLLKDVQPLSYRMIAPPAIRAQLDGEDPDDRAQWRLLPGQPQPLKTWMTRTFETPMRDAVYDHPKEGKDASFFTTTSVSIASREWGKSEAQLGSEGSSPAESEEILSQFYDHSLAVHEDLPSSRVPLSQSTVADSFVESPAVEYGSGEPNGTNLPQGEGPRPKISPHLNPTDLESVPNASYLRAIEPQTFTVNLIVGIISIPPARTIKTRRWGKEVEIIEVIVGDETKTDFGITFWLPPTQNSHSHPGDGNEMRKTLEKLRPQDILLLRNVALASFRGQVHGQSLRRNRTGVELLYRKKVDRYDEGGVYSSRDFVGALDVNVQLKKVRRVREWVLNFVSVSGPSRGGGRLRKHGGDHGAERKRRSPLPPDTQ